MQDVHPLPRVASVQLVAVDRGLGVVEIQYVDLDGAVHEIAMPLAEARRLYDALDPLADDGD